MKIILTRPFLLALSASFLFVSPLYSKVAFAEEKEEKEEEELDDLAKERLEKDK